MARDTASVAVAGRRSPAAQVVAQYLRTCGGDGYSLVWGTDQFVDPVSAALANSTAAQSLEFDDWAPGCAAHLGGILVPAIGSMSHLMTARHAVDALAVGLMIVNAMSSGSFQRLYLQGLQPTHLLGAVGAVAGLAHGLRLRPDVAADAFGLAATQALGLRVHTGTRYKGAQGGIVAAGAVRSVLLAQGGLTAGKDALDVILRIAGLSDSEVRGLTAKPLRGPTLAATKAFPTCGASHTALEATLDVRRRLGSAGGDPSAQIVVSSPPQVHNSLAFPSPANPDQARFSMPYCVAVAWLKGVVELTDFDEDALQRTDVREFMGRIEHRIDPSLDPGPDWTGYPAIVRAVVMDTAAQSRVDTPLGYPDRPLSVDETIEKFLVCTSSVLSHEDALYAFDALSQEDVFHRLDVLRHHEDPRV